MAPQPKPWRSATDPAEHVAPQTVGPANLAGHAGYDFHLPTSAELGKNQNFRFYSVSPAVWDKAQARNEPAPDPAVMASRALAIVALSRQKSPNPEAIIQIIQATYQSGGHNGPAHVAALNAQLQSLLYRLHNQYTSTEQLQKMVPNGTADSTMGYSALWFALGRANPAEKKRAEIAMRGFDVEPLSPIQRGVNEAGSFIGHMLDGIDQVLDTTLNDGQSSQNKAEAIARDHDGVGQLLGAMIEAIAATFAATIAPIIAAAFDGKVPDVSELATSIDAIISQLFQDVGEVQIADVFKSAIITAVGYTIQMYSLPLETVPLMSSGDRGLSAIYERYDSDGAAGTAATAPFVLGPRLKKLLPKLLERINRSKGVPPSGLAPAGNHLPGYRRK